MTPKRPFVSSSGPAEKYSLLLLRALKSLPTVKAQKGGPIPGQSGPRREYNATTRPPSMQLRESNATSNPAPGHRGHNMSSLKTSLCRSLVQIGARNRRNRTL
jgi:hypothetical protein